MDFFEHQEVARRKTGRLVVMFVLAVGAITVLVYAAVAAFGVGFGVWQGSVPAAGCGVPPIWQPQLLLGVGLGVVVIVTVGSVYKISQLRGGGHVVASSLGGRPINPATGDLHERKILNVVEEMAIASGVPVPQVYLMDEAGINAFAAGFSPSDAVIGVTRGCVELLDRDELQGVMAHEFSHILNGDMRLNIRLIGVVHGILVIGLIGYLVFRTAIYSGGSYRRSNQKGSPWPLIALGLALIVIGYAGVFFGKLIKSAVSRQREFLADASAVQFTRNPDGIAGALKKIGGYTFGSKLISPKVDENSHLFFGAAVASLLGWMSTHPPLGQRIGRIEPAWDGQLPEVKPPQCVVEKAARKQRQLPKKRAFGAVLTGVAVTAGGQGTADGGRGIGTIGGGQLSAVEQIGRPTTEHLEYAAALVKGLVPELKTAAHEAYGARAVIYALLLERQSGLRRTQLNRLEGHADPQVLEATRRLEPLIDGLKAAARLPLLDMAIPALRGLSPRQYRSFKLNVAALVRADDKVDLFEWSLQRMILRHLDSHFAKRRPPRVRYAHLGPLAAECAVLLSTLAYVGHPDPESAQHAFGQGAAQLGLDPLVMRRRKACSLGTLDRALDALAQVAPGRKRVVLAACAACIKADKKVTVREAELLRAISDSLDCPMPPLLAGQPLL